MNLQTRLEGLVTTAELAARPDFELGGALVSPSTRTVTGPGGKVDVEPRVMQVLVVLADAQGAVVTRDTLFRRCWGSPSVTDDSLNRAIASLRRLSGDAFQVETIKRTGYRLTVAARDDLRPNPSVSRRTLIAAGAAAAAGAGLLGLHRLGLDRTDPRVTRLVVRSEQALRAASPQSGMQAARLLEQAVAFQPSNALAWGKLALARCIASEYAAPAAVAEIAVATQEAAARALAIDPRQPDAHAALALLPPYYGDWLAADRRMAGVLALDPDHLPTRDARAFMHVAAGRERDGSVERLRIAPLEPLHAGFQFRLIYAHWVLGDVAAADRAADRAMHLWPKHSAVWFGRLWTLAFTGRPERALAHVEDHGARPTLPPGTVAALRSGMVALASRRPADVAGAVESVLRLVASGPSHALNAIMILNGLGELDRAFAVADAYLLERGPLLASIRWRPGQMSVSDQRRRKTNMLFVPVAAGMQADPRFVPLVTGIGLADYWERSGVTPDFLKRAVGR